MYANNKNNPELVAISFIGNIIVYGEMFDSTAGAEVLLKRLDISEGDTVSSVSVISPEFVYLFYACNIIGAISNLVDPSFL